MLGVCLLFVGIVLINNGVCALWKIEGWGGCCHESFYRRPVPVYQFCQSGSGKFLRCGHRPFIWLYVSVCGTPAGASFQWKAVCRFFYICGGECHDIWLCGRNRRQWISGHPAGYPLGRHLVALGAPLGKRVRDGNHEKGPGRFVPCLQIFEGIVTAWIPGVLMLLGMW